MNNERLFSSHEKAISMPNTVYHYCSMDALLSILQTSSLRLSNITKSNDPTEITNVIPVLKEVTETVIANYNKKISLQYRFADDAVSTLIDRFFEDIYNNFYVICFSEKKDLLSQWDRYADSAKGVAIGFNTRHFVKLQVESSSQYIFGKIVYLQTFLAQYIEEFLHRQIDRDWRTGDDSYNVNLIENVTTNLACTMLQYAILFKNEFFSEESEWRLVYNPLGRIRRLGYAAAYHDRMIETNQYQYEKSAFKRSEYRFTMKRGRLSSYVDLNFESIRNALIQEIIIGPKATLNPDDKDLQMLLAFHGYKWSCLPIEGKVVISKSDKPFQ